MKFRGTKLVRAAIYRKGAEPLGFSIINFEDISHWGIINSSCKNAFCQIDDECDNRQEFIKLSVQVVFIVSAQIDGALLKCYLIGKKLASASVDNKLDLLERNKNFYGFVKFSAELFLVDITLSFFLVKYL